MEIRVLRYFLAAAREGSITAAANTLHLTQPTLSRQLQDLEKELGQKLFIRGKYKVSLTPEGMILRKRAEEIVDLVEKTESEFQSIKDIVSGDIYIGCGERSPEESLNIAEENQQLRKRIKALEKENKRLSEMNAFLEDAAAFFAASRQKSGKNKG